MNSGATDERRQLYGFVLRVVIAVGITVGAGALLALLWFGVDVLLLGFSGVLFAVMLRGVADWLARHSPLRDGWSVLASIVIVASLVGVLCWFSASRVADQFNTLLVTLPQAVAKLQQQLLQYRWGEWIANQAGSMQARRMDVVGKMTGAISSVFGTLVDFVIICILGIYLAFKPQVYIGGAVRLLPLKARPRAREVIGAVGHTLRWWLIGILSTMTVIGVLSGVGLRLLGVPLALALGLLAGLLSFVPYLGAMVSALPAMLIAMINGPEQALYVAALFLGIHFVEGYLLAPLIQQYAIELPPGLLLFSQIMLGLLLGTMGVVLAAPIAATVLVAVQMLYLQDVLGEPQERSRHR